MKLTIAIVLACAGIAHAEPVPVAVGVNLPFGWAGGHSLAGSVSVGLTEHQAIRANVASYEDRALVSDVVAIAMGGDGDEATRSGRTTDLGLGWTLYPDGLWQGFTVELGGLYRHRNLKVEDDFASPASRATRTETFGGRALVGWSWLLYGRVTISAAVGVSVGHESGTETTNEDLHGMPMTTDVSRVDVEAEAFVRIGVAFGG